MREHYVRILVRILEGEGNRRLRGMGSVSVECMYRNKPRLLS